MNETLKMIMDAILPNILEIIITIISLIVARYVIPFIKNDLIPWLKEKKLYGTIKKFVQAVEKMAEAGVIEKGLKKEKVLELLAQNGVEVNPVVDSFIESCVKELDIITSTAYDEIMIETEEQE
jgi:hypothetical protein